MTDQGVHYAIWSPESESVTVAIGTPHVTRKVPLRKTPDGYHAGLDPQGRAGDAYGYLINDSQTVLPDPASRSQYEGVHGRSLVVDPASFRWTDQSWQRPDFRDLVIYELHIGTFTAEGTFRSAIERLPHLQSLGVTAIEIMPIADFPGTRNWGYDGVLIYAPARCYGTPDDLRALVDAAHGAGLAVILDVVYNHFGPDGNYLSAYSPYYFNKRHHTPWGDGFNFDAAHHGPVRDFFRRNPVYWMEEFHFDGFRLDATHEIQDDTTPHILAEITDAIHARGGYAIAEDERNSALVISPTREGGLGFDGVWADDFHHTARVSVLPARYSYFLDYEGSAEQLATVLRDGWLYSGQQSASKKAPRGTVAAHLAPEHFVHCISNHDQSGNRAFGERVHHLIPARPYRALSALICLTPYTPMLFMGQEWAASTPFLFFSDHHDELGRLVSEGRRREFAGFPEFADQKQRARIPDPQAASTFERSKLPWEEADGSPVAALYRECLGLRKRQAAFRPRTRDSWSVLSLGDFVGGLRLAEAGTEFFIAFDLRGNDPSTVPIEGRWELVLSTEEKRFGGSGEIAWKDGQLVFQGPEVVVLQRASA